MVRHNSDRYNVVVIGAGTAGLVTAAGTAALGGRVALVERHKMGGDCLNYGCVPSKALIASTRHVHAIRRAPDFGLKRVEPLFDFKEVFARMRSRRAMIEPNDSRERFEALGVDVFLGDATFVDANTVQVGDAKLKARNMVIATGGRPAIPPIEGIKDVPYYTNETIFDELHEQPRRLALIGGGPIGCELSQVFQRLGTQVTILETLSCIMSKEDPDVAAFVHNVLHDEGVDIRCGTRVQKVSRTDGPGQGALSRTIAITYSGPGDETHSLQADALLIAAGRQPNIEGLNLEKIGVQMNRAGVVVNDRLQTTLPHIYAAGDVAGGYQFTHWADAQARVIVRNILIPWLPTRIDARLVPWCTYVEPEVARVGLSESEASQKGIAYDLWTEPFERIDRAVISDEQAGFAKVLTKKGTDRIIGATLVSAHADELLHEFVLAMKHRIGLGALSQTMHVYPTLAEIARKLGDQYQRARLTPTARKLFAWLYRRART